MNKENKTTSSLMITNGINDSVESMLAFGEKIVKSGLSPMKKAEDVMAAMMMGKELGFSPIVALNNIYSINGRASTGIHIITALLLKAGISYQFIDNYRPLYRYKDKGGIVYDEDSLAGANLAEYVKSPTAYDVRTKIRFKRKFKYSDGTFETIEIEQTYCWSDAVTAELSTKDNWRKMPKIMMQTRCLTLGARLIAPDVLLGISEHTELSDMNNVKVNISEDRTEVVDAVVIDVTKDNEPEISSKVSDTNKDKK